MSLAIPPCQVVVILHTDGKVYWVTAHRESPPTFSLTDKVKTYKSRKWAVKEAQRLVVEVLGVE